MFSDLSQSRVDIRVPGVNICTRICVLISGCRAVKGGRRLRDLSFGNLGSELVSNHFFKT